MRLWRLIDTAWIKAALFAFVFAGAEIGKRHQPGGLLRRMLSRVVGISLRRCRLVGALDDALRIIAFFFGDLLTALALGADFREARIASRGVDVGALLGLAVCAASEQQYH